MKGVKVISNSFKLDKTILPLVSWQLPCCSWMPSKTWSLSALYLDQAFWISPFCFSFIIALHIKSPTSLLKCLSPCLSAWIKEYDILLDQWWKKLKVSTREDFLDNFCMLDYWVHVFLASEEHWNILKALW